MSEAGRRSPTGSAFREERRSNSSPQFNSFPKDEAGYVQAFLDERRGSGSRLSPSIVSGCNTPVSGRDRYYGGRPMESTRTLDYRDSGPDLYQQKFVGSSCDEKKSRCKKRGYDHPAAQASCTDLLSMPSHMTTVPVRLAVGRIYVAPGNNPAGLTTAKLTEIKRCDNVSKSKDNVSRRRELGRTDPITHRKFEEQWMLEEKNEELNGRAAGQPSLRMAKLNCDWDEAPQGGKSHQGNALAGFVPPPRDNDVIHDGRGDTVVIKRGQKHFPLRMESNVPMEHKDKELAPTLTPEQIREKGGVRKQKEVPIQGGNIVYNIGGYGDMLPAATKTYHKSDIPVSKEYKIQNDQRDLPKFLLPRRTQKVNVHQQSTEMQQIMYGR